MWPFKDNYKYNKETYYNKLKEEEKLNKQREEIIKEFSDRLKREFGIELNFAYNETSRGSRTVAFNNFSELNPDKYEIIKQIQFEFKHIDDFFNDYNTKQQIKETKEYDRLYTEIRFLIDFNVYQLKLTSLKNKEPEPKVKITII